MLCVSLQFDNLYIDMNGIIHPCSHPEDKPPPESEEEMYKNIMDYVDRYLKVDDVCMHVAQACFSCVGSTAVCSRHLP